MLLLDSLFLSLHPTLPLSHHLASLSQPLLRGAHFALNKGAHTHTHSERVCLMCMWTCENGRTEQKRQTHACEVAMDTASRYTSAFFSSLILTFLLFFITVIF
ncbi:hypothetical protein CHARACLAT_001614 [Characodon lateralis]|uniref:Uncharacterized protein n=1 Tax=Characodon lateralis TaxID=208331 RepID=A0ABU7E678_9TELE|nr:hypothetical protein [Characodon lateralis]